MNTLNVITVGYNEELNLQKLYESLKLFDNYDFKVRKIYIDQSSTDNSVKIANNYGCEVYIHDNKGYADPDKKWAVENLCNKDEWILILDGDEEITKKLIDNMFSYILKQDFLVYKIPIHVYFMGIICGVFLQPRLFKKSGVKLNNNIHSYISILTKDVGNIKGYIINNDLKLKGIEIKSIIEKNNRYTDKEIEGKNIGKIKIIFGIIFMPIIRFFGFGIKYKLFLKGFRGLIYCVYMGNYQFNKYAKLYEKNINKNI